MTNKKTPLENDQSSSSDHPSVATTPIIIPANDQQHKTAKKDVKATTPMINKKPAAQPTDNKTIKTKISKVGITALLIALTAAAGTAASFYWLNQQSINLTAELNTANQNNNAANQLSVTTLLDEQQNKFSQQLKQMAVKVQTDSAEKISQLQAAVTRLEQNKPSDWLIHEAEYLVRIAARTMWLERDTQAAIGLLNDADHRLAELNDPKFLPIRKLIHQDIKQLELMPVLHPENVVLSLMGLNRQLPSLPLLMEQVATENNSTAALELSNDVNDWQANLTKTWRNFLDTFVVIHIRDGSAKPLLSPQYQQNLKENLSLKLQQAQWAAREEKTELYLQTLTDIETWLTDYFDMKNISNQLFLSSIKKLKTELISYDYPSSLSSLTAMRNILTNNRQTINTPIHNRPIPLSTPDNTLEGQQKVDRAEPTKKVIKLTIEQQIHQQTTIQEQADKTKNEDGDEI